MKHHYSHGLLVLLLLVPLLAIIAYTTNNNTQKTSEKPQAQAQLPTPQTTVLAKNLDIPWALAFLPDGNIIFTERPGGVKILNLSTGQVTAAGTVSGVKHGGEGGLMGIAVHPQFATNNYIYVYYTYGGTDGDLNRLARYTLVNNQLTAPTTIIDAVPGASTHDGGRIKFGPDGFLYIATGDGQVMPAAQDPNSLAGKILRVTDTGAAAPGNPFNNRTYSYGHRNPQGITWIGNALYATEHGNSHPSRSDEVNLIEPGKNYGWPEIEGSAQREGMVTPLLHSGDDAATTWAPSGTAYWNGSIFFGALKGQGLYEVTINGTTATLKAQHLKGTFGRIREAVVGPDNQLYITTSNRDGRGTPKAEDDKIIRVSFGQNSQPSPQPTAVTPTFGVIAPCPSCASTPTIFQPLSATPPLPSNIVATPIVNDPCTAEGASIATAKKHKSKHHHHDGGISGFIEALLRFFIELLNLILRLLGGGNVPVPTPDPTDPNPVPSDVPDPDPCAPSVAPMSPQPSQPGVTAPISVPVSQSVSPTQPFSSVSPQPTISGSGFNSPNNPGNNTCIPSGQKCDATGARSCCTACVKNINVNQPDDPGTCD